MLNGRLLYFYLSIYLCKGFFESGSNFNFISNEFTFDPLCKHGFLKYYLKSRSWIIKKSLLYITKEAYYTCTKCNCKGN